MKHSATLLTLVLLALSSQTKADGRDIACATTDLLSEKAMCAWENYRGDAVWVAQAISRTLVMLDGVQKSMDPENLTKARDLLVASQEAWEAYREATCELETHLYFGGDGTPLVYAECLHRLTQARARDFRILLQEEN